MSSVNPIQPKLEKNPATPIAAGISATPYRPSPVTPTSVGISTTTDHISKLRSASKFLEDVILEGERKFVRENEDLKAQLKTLGIKYIDLEKKYKKVEAEKLEKEAEAKKWKMECDEHKERLTRAMEDLSKAKTECGVLSTECGVLSGREKRAVERYNNLLADSEKEMMKKNQEFEECESRVKKLEEDVALFLRSNPVLAKLADVMLTGAGLPFDDLNIKELMESAVPTGNALNDVIEICDSDESMDATGKRPLGCQVNKDLDDDASVHNRKRLKDLSFMMSSDSSDDSITDSYMDKLAFGKSTTRTKFRSN